MQQHLNKINSRIQVKISCRIFDPSLNNKTTVLMMQATQKDIIFKVVESWNIWISRLCLKSSWLFCSTASLKFPLCLCFGLQIQLVVSSLSAGWTSRQPALNDIPASLCTDHPLPLVKIGEGASVIHCFPWLMFHVIPVLKMSVHASYFHRATERVRHF